MKEKNNFVFGIVLILSLAITFLLDNYAFDFVDLIKNNYFDSFFGIITNIGEFFVILILLTILFLFMKKEKRKIPLLWVCFFVLGGICIILKFLIARPRPFGLIIFYPLINLIDYSFPSLHAAVILLALIILFREAPKHKLGLGFIGLLIIFSRIYLKVHYLSDVVGGAILGLVIAKFYLQNTNLKGTIKSAFEHLFNKFK
ncbi:phosphatase PAP2 family protein [Candidatus Woesearchaeota archaeon]|nr:phosphatase PAP2 family protein [Candidatus Woesearchaeota archaeon]